MTQTFKQSYYFLRQNILKLLGFTLLMGALLVLIAELLMPFFIDPLDTSQTISLETIEPFAQMLNIIVKPIYTGALIILIVSLAKTEAKTMLNCIFAGILRWPFMLVANIMTSFLIFIGFLAFILPGIWLFTRLFLVPYLVMIDNQSPLTALINSFKYTKDYSLTILSDIVILIVILIFIVLILSLMQLLLPVLLLVLLLLFQTMAHVIYYRHYEILMEKYKTK
ncbi:MAG: hypothetical protein IME94_10340 [Proteobacteria bacterium]|nr:hypothetical protein [Pseudomonadota bacterium]